MFNDMLMLLTVAGTIFLTCDFVCATSRMVKIWPEHLSYFIVNSWRHGAVQASVNLNAKLISFFFHLGASACVQLNQFQEAITWCDKGLAVSFIVRKQIIIKIDISQFFNFKMTET